MDAPAKACTLRCAAFRSCTDTKPASIARDTQRRAALQKAFRCATEQKSLGLPWRRPRDSWPPHQTQEVGSAESVALIG
jgi:hypothetical protein